MRQTIQTLSAAGYAPWVTLDYLEAPFSVGLGGILSSNANLTWGVQYTYDDIGPQGGRSVSIVQNASTTATITDIGDPSWTGQPGHGLSAADSVVIQGSQIGIDGTYQVAAVTNQTTYTITTAINQTASGGPSSTVNGLRVYTHSVLTALTTRKDSNIAAPVRACRLVCTAYTAGYVQLCILQGSSA